jgi:ribose 5-phosphate isomerase B
VLVHTGNVTIVRVAAAFDHRGVRLRERVLGEIEALGHDFVDLGVDTDADRVDYPDKAREVGDAIRSGAADRAVFVCGSGVGASVAASKLAGIRAAVCHDPYSARQGVEHDDMNVLCLGSDVIGPELVPELVRAFLRAEFNGGERYVRRLDKIARIEREMSHG